jgi:hypothetical protein
MDSHRWHQSDVPTLMLSDSVCLLDCFDSLGNLLVEQTGQPKIGKLYKIPYMENLSLLHDEFTLPE